MLRAITYRHPPVQRRGVAGGPAGRYMGAMPVILHVAAGGALGAAARHLVNTTVPRFVGGDFPWATAGVNVAGSFVAGLVVGAMLVRWNAGPEMRAFLITGILGGFTTFSAFSVDVASLVERGLNGLAVLYAGGSVGLSIAAVFAGLGLARLVLA